MSDSLLRWRGVSRTYPGAIPVHALRPTDLDIAAGERLAVVGPSGSGKSTVLNILGLLDRPTSGTYELLGRQVGGLAERERAATRAHHIGFVFQAFHLMGERTTSENVELGLLYAAASHRERRRLAGASLERVGLSHRANALASTLSGGERQRTAVARAIVHRPRLLLADEPTGSLDRTTGNQVLELLAGLGDDGMAQVVVTHDPVVAATADRIVEIVDGVTEPRAVDGVAR